MFVIIKKLEANVGISDIEKFAFHVPNAWFFSRKGKVNAIKIIALEDKYGKVIERHCLIRVTPDAYKKRLIRSLISHTLNGEKVIAADYIIRHWSNDPRVESRKSTFSLENQGSRQSDRRRTGLNLVTVAEKTYP